MSNPRGRIVIWLCRLGFAGWLVFEFLNWIGLLQVPLSFTWFGLIITDGAAWLSLEIISHWLRRRTGNGLAAGMYALVFFGVSLDALGDVMRWYVRFDWYDQAAHVLAGGIIVGLVALNILWALRGAGRIRLSIPGMSLVAWAFAGLVGSFYEVEEYLEDVINQTPGKRLGDGPDTANDILLNLIGSAAVLLIASFILRRRQKPLPDQSAQS